MKKALLIFLALFVSNLCFAANDAEVHLQKMLEKYKSLSSYEDRGNSITKFTKANDQMFTSELRFKTKYIEATVLYFEWLEMPNEFEKKMIILPGFKGMDPSKPKKNAVWKDGTGVYNKYSFGEKESVATLSKALSGATGISSGLAWMVPRYLTSDIPCSPNLGSNESRILNSKNNIITIELTRKSGRTEIMYIDKKTYLLKKYESKHRLPNGTNTHQIVEFDVIDYK